MSATRVRDRQLVIGRNAGGTGGTVGIVLRPVRLTIGWESMLGNGRCESTCNTESCDYDGGDCIRETQPYPYYVSSRPQDPAVGSFAHPYTGLYSAFQDLWSSFSIIYLLSGNHSLILPAGASNLDPLAGFTLTLTLTTLYCSGSPNDHSECSYSRAQLFAPRNKIAITVNRKLTLLDLDIRGDYDLVPGCFEWTCTMCPFVRYNSELDIWLSDQGTVLNSTKIAKMSLCEAFAEFNFITAMKGAVLHIQQVTFKHHRQRLKSLLTSFCANITLIEVDFYDIQNANNSGNSAIVRQQPSPSYCGTFRYTHGTVSFLNNGFELQSNTLTTGFMRVNTMEVLLFDNVTFEYNNIMVGTSAVADSALMYFVNPRQVTIRNCFFQYNMAVTGGAFALTSNQPLPVLLDPENQLIEQNFDHFVIENTRFWNNSASFGGAFFVSFASDHQNIQIRNCSFEHNFASLGGIIQVQNAFLTDEFAAGVTNSMLIEDDIVEIYYPPRYLIIENVNMTSNYGPGILLLSNIGQLRLINVKLEGCGRSTTGQNSLDIVLQGYIQHPETYMKGIGLTATSPQCLNVISTVNVYNVTLERVNILKGYCDLGSPGWAQSGNSSVVTAT